MSIDHNNNDDDVDDNVDDNGDVEDDVRFEKKRTPRRAPRLFEVRPLARLPTKPPKLGNHLIQDG